MNDNQINCEKVFDKYINQLERVIDETYPSMGSFFETDLTLFCIKNNYFFAITKDKN